MRAKLAGLLLIGLSSFTVAPAAARVLLSIPEQSEPASLEPSPLPNVPSAGLIHVGVPKPAGTFNQPLPTQQGPAAPPLSTTIFIAGASLSPAAAPPITAGEIVVASGDFSTTSGPITLPPFDFVPVASAVPEPSTWAMLLLGFAGLGALMLRRRRLARVAAV